MNADRLRGVLATVGSLLSSGAVSAALSALGVVPAGIAAVALRFGLPAVGTVLTTWTKPDITEEELGAACAAMHRVEPFDLETLLG